MRESETHSTRVAMAVLLLALVAWLWPAMEVEAATSSASYRVTFQGTWTTAVTPGGLPGGAHFSPLIGTVHSDGVVFWESGATASRGVEDVAELGSTSAFRREIEDSGQALSILERSLPGGGTPQAHIDFEATSDYPLVTLITMIAPSPDWFVGVSGLSLLDDEGRWRDSLEVDLFPYDAGTEDGDGFSLSNPATAPRGVITSIRGEGRFTEAPMAKLTFACQNGCPPPTPTVHGVPLFPSSLDQNGRQGFVRVINRSSDDGEIDVVAIDDAGVRSTPLTLVIGTGQTVHINSHDLETGNEKKGLSGGTGAMQGDLRLQLVTQLDVEVLAFIRHVDGFLTTMHETVPRKNTIPSNDIVYRAAIFNPGGNKNQKSLLRLINPGTEDAAVSIQGIDDAGNTSGSVRLTLPAGAARMDYAATLESNENGNGAGASETRVALEGELGTGAGKWRLIIRSEQPLTVMSLMESPSGHLTNLSTAPVLRSGIE